MINANFSGVPSDVALKLSTTAWQYDTGQTLCVSGLSGIDASTEVHFERKLRGDAVVKTGEYDSGNNTLTVDIPDVFFEYADGTPGRVWIYPRVSDDEGKTVREINIPIAERERPDDYISQDDLSRDDALSAAVDTYLDRNGQIIDSAVEDYFDDHPASTDNIADGAVTPQKLSAALTATINDKYTKTETAEILRARMPSVKDYGAKGDGTTDDTEAIYKAIINNDVVYFPPGVYRTAGIIITNPEHPTVRNWGEANETIETAPRCPKTLIGAGRRSVLKPIDAKGYGFFCKRCGHVHRGAELPAAGYQCPVCESDRTYLVKINSDAVLKIGRKIEKGAVVPKDYADRVDECTISDLTIEANYTVTIPDDDAQPLPEEETEAVDGTSVSTATQVAEIEKTDTETESDMPRVYASTLPTEPLFTTLLC